MGTAGHISGAAKADGALVRGASRVVAAHQDAPVLEVLPAQLPTAGHVEVSRKQKPRESAATHRHPTSSARRQSAARWAGYRAMTRARPGRPTSTARPAIYGARSARRAARAAGAAIRGAR